MMKTGICDITNLKYPDIHILKCYLRIFQIGFLPGRRFPLMGVHHDGKIWSGANSDDDDDDDDDHDDDDDDDGVDGDDDDDDDDDNDDDYGEILMMSTSPSSSLLSALPSSSCSA